MAADSPTHRHQAASQVRPQYTVRWEFDPEPDALTLVRAAFRYRLAEWGIAGEDAHGAVLVISELVTNAVEHSGSRLDVTVTYQDSTTLRIAVHDDSPEPARLRRPHPTAMRGRGLQIVDALATRWGSTPDAVGKTVWAEVPPGTAWFSST